MADTIEQHPSAASGPPQYRTNEEKVDADLSRDDTLLATLGYKAELKREFTALEVFGLAFSIIGLLPSIASTLVYSMPAGGPVGMVCKGTYQKSTYVADHQHIPAPQNGHNSTTIRHYDMLLRLIIEYS
jgi:hypothetical protein